MPNFTTRKTFLVPSFDLDVKEEEKMYRYLTLLEKSNVSKLFPKRSEIDLPKGGRPSYNDCNLLATILYGFAFGNPTLRDLASKKIKLKSSNRTSKANYKYKKKKG